MTLKVLCTRACKNRPALPCCYNDFPSNSGGVLLLVHTSRDSGESETSYRKALHVGAHAWALIGVLVAVALVAQVAGLVSQALELLLVGVILGFICSPVTNWLEDRNVPRALAAFLALVFVLAVFVLVVVLLAPPFVSQLMQVLQRVPYYVEQVRSAIADFWTQYGTSETADVKESLDQTVASLSNLGVKMASDATAKLSNGLISNVVSTVNNVFTIFLGLVVAYWLAKDYPGIVREATVIAGPRHRDDLLVLLSILSRSMGGYMRGIVITSTVGGLLSFLGFSLIGHPFAGLMGIVVGIFHFVPVVGPWLAAAIAALLALSASPMLALESIIVSVVAQNVTDNLVSPLVMQSAVRVHPILSLTGIIIGNALGGVLGMALAIPLTAAARGIFVFYFEKRTGRQLVSEDGRLFKGDRFANDDGSPKPASDALDDDDFLKGSRLVPPGDPGGRGD